MRVRMAHSSDLEAMVLLAAALQAEPADHIGYLGLDGDSIRTDVLGVEAWVERTAVVVDDARKLAGWLTGEKDEEMNRAWWWGPFLTDDAWEHVADELYVCAAGAVDAAEEEMAPDDRNRRVGWLAQRHGFQAEEASAALSYIGDGFADAGAVTLEEASAALSYVGDGFVDAGAVPLEEGLSDQVVALHDRLFPGTHTTGAALVRSADPRLVFVESGVVVGYVAAEVHSDGTGYIDYLGVDPNARRQGVGRRLVMDATTLLLASGVASVHLTVREHNIAARSLYESLGFTHERLIRPFRKGFTLSS